MEIIAFFPSIYSSFFLFIISFNLMELLFSFSFSGIFLFLPLLLLDFYFFISNSLFLYPLDGIYSSWISWKLSSDYSSSLFLPSPLKSSNSLLSSVEMLSRISLSHFKLFIYFSYSFSFSFNSSISPSTLLTIIDWSHALFLSSLSSYLYCLFFSFNSLISCFTFPM